MLNLNSILVGSENPQALAKFYEDVFQKKPDMQEEGWYGFSVGACFISIGAHDKVKGKSVQPERLMFNLETSDVEGEATRIEKIAGVTVIAKPYAMGDNANFQIATFADPDGNYFQLMTPWESEK